MIILEARCPKHPQYKGKRDPKALCSACWFINWILNDDEKWPDDWGGKPTFTLTVNNGADGVKPVQFRAKK